MKNLKRKIKHAVTLYKETFFDEYIIVIQQIKEYRDSLKDDFAKVDGDHVLKRELFRVPEKLYTIIVKNLSDEELQMMDSKEYSKWFIKEFPQFKITKHD